MPPRQYRARDLLGTQQRRNRYADTSHGFLTRDGRPAAAIVQQGCAIEEGSAGPYIQTDASKETTVAGIFACGDAARPSGSVAMAVGDGALAGVATHLSLVFE